MALTDIADRKTPSVPIEITFGAQPIATGRKYTTLFGHMTASPGLGLPYQVYNVVNVGDPVAAQAEVDALAGSGSQIGKMAYAFVAANSLVGRANFPAFRVVLLPNAELHFGPSSEAITAVQLLRSDMFVSCYPAGDSTNRQTLINLATTISGPDRDLSGQFGSFVTFGSIDPLATQEAYAINSRYALVACLPDSNTALVNLTADTTSGSDLLTNVVSVAGVYPGAQLSGTGIPSGAVVEQVQNGQIKMSANATATNAAEAVAAQNVVSQAPEIVASAHAAGMMQSAFPYNPLAQVAIGGLVPPQKSSDLIVVDPSGSSEAALSAGLSPLVIQPGNVVAFLRTVTTFTLLPLNVPVTAYYDWQDLVTLNDFREDVFLITQNPPFNNNPGGTKASAQIAALLKDEILREAQSYEDEGAFQAVKALAPQFQVAPSATRGRFDFKIPVNVLPGLMVIAGNIEAVTDFNFSL